MLRRGSEVEARENRACEVWRFVPGPSRTSRAFVSLQEEKRVGFSAVVAAPMKACLQF